MGTFAADLEAARGVIQGSKRLVVLSGAGISTASGIPDFRGPEGIWTKDPDAEMLSTYDAYVNEEGVRARAWASRLSSPTWTATPNAAHDALVRLEERGILDTVITQNIDRLHQAAGQDPERVIEIHGNAHETVCLRCGDRRPMDETLERVANGDADPRCRASTESGHCGGILKSATISFGQALVARDLAAAEAAARRCDVLLAVGSTLSVFPIAGVVPIAHAAGATIIIVNAEPTAMDHLATIILRSDITEVLTALVD